MEEWYYQQEDSEFGPICDTELRTLLHSGKITPEAKIRKHPSVEWVPAKDVLPEVPRPPAIPPPLPSANPSTPPPVDPPIRAIAGPTGWLWFSASLLVMNELVLCFMQFVFAIYALFLLVGITGLPDWCIQSVNALDSYLMWPRLGMFVLLILWQGCAFGSILRLYGESRLQHGRGSGFWWITPVANLFMPFQCLRELRWASREQRGIQETHIPAGVLVWLIQASIIFNVLITVSDKLVTVANSASVNNADTFSSNITTGLNLASNLGGMAQSCLLTIYVLHNLIHQIRLYRECPPEAAH
jgi:hypothetical protein